MFAYFLRYLFSLSWHTQQRLHKGAEFLHLLRISEFFGFQWQNLTEILRLLPKVLQSENEAVIMITSPLYNICLQQMWLFESLLKSRGLSFGAGLKKLLLCLIFIGQSLAWKWFTRFFCRESVNAAITRFFVANVTFTRFFLSRMSWLRAFWGRILHRNLAEILRNTQNFGRNSD